MKKIIVILTFFFLPGYCYAQPNESTVSMKEYIDKIVELQMKVSDIRYENIEKNVMTANAAMDKRMDAVNEFRGQLKDQVATFPTRKELWGYIVALAGMFFGFMRWQKDRKQEVDNTGRNIKSGDTVEVKK